MEKEKIQLNLPESWFEVSIEKFQELATYNGGNSITNSINIISCLADVDPMDIKLISAEDLKRVIDAIQWIVQDPSPEFKHTINIDGIDYSMIPKLNEMTVGEWIDIETFSENYLDNMHNIMSILYRPLISTVNDETRFIEKYDAQKSLRTAELFKEKMNVGDVYGAALFFSLIGLKFTNNLALYLEQETVEMKKN
jgi:hypothetical protein